MGMDGDQAFAKSNGKDESLEKCFHQAIAFNTGYNEESAKQITIINNR